jgi:hypothetical protein
MAPRPPSDAVVALRSLGRRFRALFAGLGEDESPDDLARRSGPDAWSARDHLVAATDAIAEAARAIAGPLALTLPLPAGPIGASTTVDDDVDELAAWAGALADGVEHVAADDWARSGAATPLWTAVDAAVEHLREAQRTLAEVRGRP